MTNCVPAPAGGASASTAARAARGRRARRIGGTPIDTKGTPMKWGKGEEVSVLPWNSRVSAPATSATERVRMAIRTGVLPERYAEARPIGQGGMGEIYRARDRELGRDVAVKLLDERFADDASLRRRFRREALAAARLSGTPHIVTIFDVGEWRGRPFIVMEYLPGGTLAERA